MLRPVTDRLKVFPCLRTINDMVLRIQLFYLWHNASTLLSIVSEVDQVATELEMSEGEVEDFEIKDQELL